MRADQIDLDRLAELAHAATPGPWDAYADRMGHWEVNIPVTQTHEANALFLASLTPEVVLALIDAASAWLVSRPRPEPKAPTGLTGDEWRPWWVLDRTGVSKPMGMWSKALADSSVAALGDPERYVVDQAEPEG